MTSGVFMPKLKDYAVFAGWIAGILLIGSLCWFLTQSFRTEQLMRAVNRTFSEGGYTLSLEKPIPARELPPRTSALGQWFQGGTDRPDRRVLVFTMIDGGAFFPCAALVDSDGKVEEIIPLNGYSERLLDRVSPGVVRFYTHRIEGGFSPGLSGLKEEK